MTVHLDVSELVRAPRRTGIQRVERELIRRWPGPAPLRACRFDHASGEMLELPDGSLEMLSEDARPGGIAAEAARLERDLRPGRLVRPARLLNAELFSDPARAVYYRARPSGQRTFWLVYDFLPWLCPDWFDIGSAVRLMPYLHALDTVSDVAFISARTKTEYESRIARRHAGGPVIPMGGDGPGLERQVFKPERRTFVMLGAIEPRKNAVPVMEAFIALWREGVDVRLTMIGNASPDAHHELALLRTLADERQFRHLRDLSDAGVCDALRTARAMLFPSVGEGYGIPPMEALHAGIPVIVEAGLPALADQPALGQVRLERVSADTIAGAVRMLLDDVAGAGLWQDAGRMVVPGWDDFAHRLARWVQDQRLPTDQNISQRTGSTQSRPATSQ